MNKATRPRRDQLVDGRIDCGVLTADARAGQRAEKGVAGKVPGECSQRRRREINGDGDEEQFFPAEPIGAVSKEKRAENGACEIESGAGADLRVGQTERLSMSEDAGKRTGQRYFEAVENPGGAERADD